MTIEGYTPGSRIKVWRDSLPPAYRDPLPIGREFADLIEWMHRYRREITLGLAVPALETRLPFAGGTYVTRAMPSGQESV